MTTRYMTAAEFEALSDEALYVMKMSGDEVVIVEDTEETTAPDAGEHVPDVSFSFMPTAGKQGTPVSALPEQTAPAPSPAPTPLAQPGASTDRQTALLEAVVSLQQQTLAEIRSMRAEMSQLVVGREGAPQSAAPAQAGDEDDAVATLQQMMQALDAEIARQTKGDG